jgi:ribosomal protein L35
LRSKSANAERTGGRAPQERADRRCFHDMAHAQANSCQSNKDIVSLLSLSQRAPIYIMPSKSVTKRIRITKNGKIVRRRGGVGHFKTRKNSKMNRNSRKTRSLEMPLKTILNN